MTDEINRKKAALRKKKKEFKDLKAKLKKKEKVQSNPIIFKKLKKEFNSSYFGRKNCGKRTVLDLLVY